MPIRVLAAVIKRDETYLIARRPSHKRHGGLWEFPGGKLEPHEKHLSAARRELAEELGIEVLDVGMVLFSQLDPGSDFLIEFVEVMASGEPRALEHDSVAWVGTAELHLYDLAPADRAFVETSHMRIHLGG